MKKLFLTSGIIACMACPAFATGFTPDNVPAGYTGMSGGHSYTPESSGTTTLAEQCVDGNLNTFSGSSTLTAQWVPVQTQITYVHGTATSGNQTRSADADFAGSTASQNTTYDVTGYTAAQNGFSTYGFHFVNWTSDYNTATGALSDTPYSAGASLGDQQGKYKVANNVTMTANWTADQYKLSYNCGDGDLRSGATLPSNVDITYGLGYTFIGNKDDAQCYKNGYHFDHWNCVGATSNYEVGNFSATNDPNTDRAYGNHTAEAVTNWAYGNASSGLQNGENISCTAIYAANEIGLAWTDSMDNTTYQGGTSCTFNAGIVLPETPTKTGYVFTGWSASGTTDPNLDGDASTPAQSQEPGNNPG